MVQDKKFNGSNRYNSTFEERQNHLSNFKDHQLKS